MDRQEQSIKSVTAGSQIPVYRVMVGNGQGQVPLKKLRSNIIRRKAYRRRTTRTLSWRRSTRASVSSSPRPSWRN